MSLDDPDGQPLRGRAIVSERQTVDVILLDAGTSAMSSDFIDCGRGLALEERPGEGIAFLNGSVGQPDLVDQDGVLACNDGLQDFAIAAGACGPIDPLGVGVLPLRNLSLPALVCVRSIAEPARRFQLRVESIEADRIRMAAEADVTKIKVVYAESSLPETIALQALGPAGGADARTFTLSLTATDGDTPMALDREDFAWRGESLLVFGRPPVAARPQDQIVDCASPAGAAVALDGAGSLDPDGGRLEHLWILEDVPGTPSVLGVGERTQITLPLGVHSIAHRVRNPKGLVAFARFGVTVVDRTPPEAAALARPGVLWPPNHRLVPVHVDLVPSDACASSIGVSLLGARSSEPDDAPGSGDGSTRGDIAGVAEGDDRDVLLRAERSSSGPGRIYILTYRVSDGSGNARTIDVNVAVPREFLK